ncbi:hypothetical protein SAMN06295879_1824 [Agreia bicolorata]|uniref:Membrane-anchored glycerophosphoryl diester phosphodiesterase (GDPDase), membrane domain n=2 Tax=Agreia bicolorata TaxID=110935 RepID=A0A1T4XWA2_9MICO|nr:hypothetical protein [Agreia bicolorata]SKA93832.1 hypothetical protein SAMN06295879_1824 [Agreia bicolorata]
MSDSQNPYGGIPQASFGPPSAGYPHMPPPAPAGWAPPPRPGLLPLRPLSFGMLLGAPFQVLRRNPAATFGSALITQLATSLVTVFVVGGAGILAFNRIDSALPEDRDAVTAGAWATVILASLIPVALSILSSALLQGVLVVEVARGTLGEKNRMGVLWRAAGRRLWPLVAWFAVLLGVIVIAVAAVVGLAVLIGVVGSTAIGDAAIGVAIGVGVLGALVLTASGIWLGTKTALVPSIIVLERRGMLSSIRRSWSLTNGSFWKTFGVLALISVILSFASQIITTPVSFIGGLATGFLFPTGGSEDSASFIAVTIVTYGLTLIISLVLGAVTAVVQSSAVAVIYIDLRMRREGLDLDLMRYVEARHTGGAHDVPDPYLVSSQRNG